MSLTPLAEATPFPFERQRVLDCLDAVARPPDAVFSEAFSTSLAALEPRRRRGALAGTTGHVAESVAELILGDFGWTVVWQHVGPGPHGVDLMFLGPGAERLVAVEVKGTLKPRRWPRLRRGELTQMAREWLDKPNNPAMSEWGVTSEDVYGAVVLVNLHDLLFRVGVTADFSEWLPVRDLAELASLDWLDVRRGESPPPRTDPL
jgi:hypothetical protein